MRHYDIEKHMSAVEDLIGQTDNPHHRAILENYRRHSFLEFAGRFKEILTPQLTVADPVYRIYMPETGLRVYDGYAAVADEFYGPMAANNSTVITKKEGTHRVAVADWGFATEQVIFTHMPGAVAAAAGYEVDDPEAIYMEERWVSMHWTYTSDALLIGEHLYAAPYSSVTKLEDREWFDMNSIRDEVARILDRGPYRKD